MLFRLSQLAVLLPLISFAVAAPVPHRRSRAVTEIDVRAAPNPCDVEVRASNSSSPSSSSSSKMKILLPSGSGMAKWSTAKVAGDNALPLTDSTFNPTKIAGGLGPVYDTAPGDDEKSLHAHYPKGSYIPSKSPRGGFSFYAPGPDSVDLTKAKELTFGYSVYFPDDFDFVKGGKMPGVYGGDNADVAATCSGGNKDSRCFSSRMMWRTDGQGEIYAYLPPDIAANTEQCNDESMHMDCNSVYGTSIGRGNFSFKTGGWTTVSQRVKLNDNGKDNAELELFVGGESVISIKNLRLTTSSEGKIRGLQMQTFFGGSTTEWASPKDQDVYFKDFSVAVLDEF